MKRITIGRNPQSDIVVDAYWETVSNEHADVELTDEGLCYRDHSTNGTLINKKRIHNASIVIYPRDEILLAGKWELRWEALQPFFNTQQPTVRQSVGRSTVRLDAAGNGGGQAQHGRPTENMGSGHGVSRPTEQSSPREANGLAENFGIENSHSQAEVDQALGKWNWGAFLSGWIWAVAHKCWWPLAILLVSWIPYLGIIASLCLAVYLGLNGSRIAWRSGKYADFEAFRKAQRSWAIAGVVLFVLGVIYTAFTVDAILSQI